MGFLHIESDRLQAWIDGEIDDPKIGVHVRLCDECRMQVGDTRLIRILARRARPDPTHPDAETLAAFIDERLEQAAAARIERHLERCDICLHAVIDLRAVLQAEPRQMDTLPDALHRQIVAMLEDEGGSAEDGEPTPGPRVPPRTLTEMVSEAIERIADNLRVRIRPLMPPPEAFGRYALDDPYRSAHLDIARLPSFASHEVPLHYERSVAFLKGPGRGLPGARPTETLRIGRFLVIAREVHAKGHAALINLEIFDAATGEPVDGLQISHDSAHGREHHTIWSGGTIHLILESGTHALHLGDAGEVIEITITPSQRGP